MESTNSFLKFLITNLFTLFHYIVVAKLQINFWRRGGFGPYETGPANKATKALVELEDKKDRHESMRGL
jgi:hypothetical protein